MQLCTRQPLKTGHAYSCFLPTTTSSGLCTCLSLFTLKVGFLCLVIRSHSQQVISFVLRLHRLSWSPLPELGPLTGFLHNNLHSICLAANFYAHQWLQSWDFSLLVSLMVSPNLRTWTLSSVQSSVFLVMGGNSLNHGLQGSGWALHWHSSLVVPQG